MKDLLDVLVICLTYNHEKYIKQTLDGFAMQKYTCRVKFIIHDDASTDNTEKIVREYEKKYSDRLIGVYEQENQYSQHIPITKRLIEKYDSKYICFCEGDDFWIDENKIQKQYEILEANNDCSICVHRTLCINEDGSRNERIYPRPSARIDGLSGKLEDSVVASALWVYDDYPFHTSSYFVRREVYVNQIDTNLEFKKGFGAGDQRILRKALANGHFYFIDEKMSVYRLFSLGSWTSHKRNESRKKTVEALTKEIYGDAFFDKYTGYRFHDYIIVCFAKKILRIASHSSAHEGKKLLYLIGDNFSKAIKPLPLSKRVGLILLQNFPFVFDLFIKFKIKDSKNGRR